MATRLSAGGDRKLVPTVEDSEVAGPGGTVRAGRLVQGLTEGLPDVRVDEESSVSAVED